MQYLAQFFSIEYWFGFPPIITQPLLIALVAVFGVFFIVGMVALMLYPRIENRWHRQIVRRGSSGAAWIGFLGLLLTFMRYERIPVFMYRYWFLFVGIALVVWVVRVRRYAIERRAKLEAETRLFETKEKYLRR